MAQQPPMCRSIRFYRQRSSIFNRNPCWNNDHCFAGAVLEDDAGDELLPAAGLVTSSEEYYPTIAINALMRTLREPAMVSHHEPVVKALFAIIGALGLNSVPYLPKVWFPNDGS